MFRSRRSSTGPTADPCGRPWAWVSEDAGLGPRQRLRPRLHCCRDSAAHRSRLRCDPRWPPRRHGRRPQQRPELVWRIISSCAVDERLIPFPVAFRDLKGGECDGHGESPHAGGTGDRRRGSERSWSAGCGVPRRGRPLRYAPGSCWRRPGVRATWGWRPGWARRARRWASGAAGSSRRDATVFWTSRGRARRARSATRPSNGW